MRVYDSDATLGHHGTNYRVWSDGKGLCDAKPPHVTLTARNGPTVWQDYLSPDEARRLASELNAGADAVEDYDRTVASIATIPAPGGDAAA